MNSSQKREHIKNFPSGAMHSYSAIHTSSYPALSISILMTDAVDEAALQKAVQIIQKRYSCLMLKRIVLKGKIAFIKNDKPLVVKNTDTPLVLCSDETNEHIMCFTFFESTVRIQVFHAVTDGYGIMELAKTLIMYYCRSVYDGSLVIESARKADDAACDDELEDILASPIPGAGRLNVSKYIKKSFGNKNILNIYETTNNYTVNKWLKVSESDLLAVCKKTDNTPSTLLALLYSKALREVFPKDHSDMLCSLAVSLRGAYNNSKTMQNAALFTNIKITDRILSMPDEKRGTALRGQLLLGTDPSVMAFTKSYMQKALSMIENIPFWSVKTAILKKMTSMSKNGSTFNISYFGSMELGAAAPYVNGVFTELNGSDMGAFFSIIAASGYFCISYLENTCIKNSENSRILDAFCKELGACGIAYSSIERNVGESFVQGIR